MDSFIRIFKTGWIYFCAALITVILFLPITLVALAGRTGNLIQMKNVDLGLGLQASHPSNLMGLAGLPTPPPLGSPPYGQRHPFQHRGRKIQPG